MSSVTIVEDSEENNVYAVSLSAGFNFINNYSTSGKFPAISSFRINTKEAFMNFEFLTTNFNYQEIEFSFLSFNDTLLDDTVFGERMIIITCVPVD